MRGHEARTGRGTGGDGRIKFAALPGTVTGYGDRGVDGMAYPAAGDYHFLDSANDSWWIIFQPTTPSGTHAAQVRGDILACSASPGESVHVLKLAGNVLQSDADEAFRTKRPASYEDAADVAAGIPEFQE